MAQSLIACPLCSAPSFSSTNALCLSLINVASKWLRCTLCEEELRGLDKLTVHLLGHLIHTTDFKKCLNDNVAVDEKSVCTAEPLNLVKTQNDQWNEDTSLKSKPDTIASSSLQAKMIPDILNERLSLKIDDEVMIFFNCNDKDSQTKCNDVIRASEKPNEISHLTGLPKFTINFSKEVNKLNEDSFATEGRNALLSNMYFDPPTSNQIPHFFFAADNNSTCKNDLSPLPDNDHQMDLSSLDKQKECASYSVETNTSDSHLSESHMYNSTEKQVCNKSSFLSPKGERVLGFRCDICSLVFPDENILSMHRQLIHIELTGDPSETNSYRCHLCSKSFVMKGSLMVHMRVAHFGGAVVARLVEAKQLETNAVSPDSAQFVCSICNKGFKKEHQLTQHEKLHDGKQCDICLKTFTTKYFLRKHKRLHTGEMPYTCSVCNKSFTFQQSYHKHLLYHSDDKPYCCMDCGRAFKELSTLHNHQRIHTGEKPFSCETCGKCFRQRVSYLVHRRIHTGVMPYRCQDCGKTFRYKVSERTHKCAVSTAGDSSEATDPSAGDTSKEFLSSVENSTFQRNAIDNGQQSETLDGPQVSAGDQVMSDTYPESADFFSLVMSPSDRLQHLSLSAETSPQPETSHDSIDTEALTQLLYDVADYN